MSKQSRRSFLKTLGFGGAALVTGAAGLAGQVNMAE